APAMFGASAFFTLNKDGKVHYTYSSGADTDDGGQRVNKEWDIPPEEAANFLNGMLQDGLLELPDGTGQGYPNHFFTASYGRWQLSAHPAAMPANIMLRLRPFLESAHPDFWKKVK